MDCSSVSREARNLLNQHAEDEQLLKLASTHPSEIALIACKVEKRDPRRRQLLDKLREMGGPEVYPTIARGAAVSGDEELVDQMIRLGATNFDQLVCEYIEHGKLDQAKRLLGRQLTTVNKAALFAATNDSILSNYYESIFILLEWGADNVPEIAVAAVSNRNSPGFDGLMDYYGDEIPGMDQVIKAAVEHRDGQTVLWLIEGLINKTAMRAAALGLVETSSLLVAKGADVYRVAREAAGHGHLELVKLLVPKCSVSLDSIATEAAANGHRQVVDFLLEEGVSDPKAIRETLKRQARGELDAC